MAALQWLLRETFEMGDIHSLPELRSSRAGQLRFLMHEEECLLFAATQGRSVEAGRQHVLLVDTCCRLGGAPGLR